MTQTPTCTWLGAEEGWRKPDGRPCVEDHCALRGRCPNHVAHEAGVVTCASCIGQTRAGIKAIVELHALMLPEAIEAGLDSEAANLAGPSASAEQVDARRRYDDAQRGWCAYPKAADDLHPYAVLGRWDLALREDYGPQTDLFITVKRAADFLVGLLAGPFPHTREFEEFVKEIAACRTHLEAVLHDSRKPEQGRPCPRCSEALHVCTQPPLCRPCANKERAPRLRKRYAEHAKGAKFSTCLGAAGGCKTCTGANDTWHCPDEPEHWWTEFDYRDRVAVDYVEHAAELPARELADRIGVSLSTVRKWCAREWDESTRTWVGPRLVSRRKGADGRKVYPVRAALALATPPPLTRPQDRLCETDPTEED